MEECLKNKKDKQVFVFSFFVGAYKQMFDTYICSWWGYVK